MTTLLNRIVAVGSAMTFAAVVALSVTTVAQRAHSANVTVADITSKVAHHYPT